MKIKYAIIYAALAVAFVAVSLWVILSGGHNAKAIRAKFRLGGLMLTISSMLTVASCGGVGGGLFPVMCYDPAIPEYASFSTASGSNKVGVGDTINISVKDLSEGKDTLFYGMRSIEAEKDTVFQQGQLGIGDGEYAVKIEETDFRGRFIIEVTAGEHPYMFLGNSNTFELQ